MKFKYSDLVFFCLFPICNEDAGPSECEQIFFEDAVLEGTRLFRSIDDYKHFFVLLNR